VWQVEQGTPSFRASIGIANAALPPAKAAAPTKSDNVKSARAHSLFIFSIVKLLLHLADFGMKQAILALEKNQGVSAIDAAFPHYICSNKEPLLSGLARNGAVECSKS